MRKFSTLLFVFFLLAGGSRVCAQTSLVNTAWKFYVEALHDTLTMHIGKDTTFSTSSAGEMIVRSHVTMTGDTIKLKDIDGEYPCMDGEGTYRYKIEGDYMSFILIGDPCPNRSNALQETKFKRAEMK